MVLWTVGLILQSSARNNCSCELQKRNFKKPDKVPKTYDRRSFSLDRKMEFKVAFANKMMTTDVYIKWTPTINY